MTKRILLLLGLSASVALAQPAMLDIAPRITKTSPKAETPGVINTTDVPNLFGELWNTLIGQGATNLGVTIYGTYTPSLKKWGEGIVLSRNIPIGGGIATGIGVGLDRYGDDLFGVTGQIGLSATVRPLAGFGSWGTNFIATPLTFVGLGTPFGDSSSTTGDLETIAAVGVSFHIAKVLGGQLGVMGLYGTRTGLGEATGTFYGGGIDLVWAF